MMFKLEDDKALFLSTLKMLKNLQSDVCNCCFPVGIAFLICSSLFLHLSNLFFPSVKTWMESWCSKTVEM